MLSSVLRVKAAVRDLDTGRCTTRAGHALTLAGARRCGLFRPFDDATSVPMISHLTDLSAAHALDRLADRQTALRAENGRDGLDRLATTRASDPDADFGVLLRHVHPGTPGVHDFHRHHFLPHGHRFVRRGEGREKREV